MPAPCVQPYNRLLTTSSKQVGDGVLNCTLQDGILHDQDNRTGSIVANYQFQFDGPPQAGAIYTGGWSVCKNDSIALGGSTLFWFCLSGSFENLYDRHVADQCKPYNIVAIGYKASSSSSSVASSTTSRSVSIGSSMLLTLSSETLATPTASVSDPRATGNGTVSTGGPSSSSGTATPTPAGSGASAAPSSTGAAVPTKVPRGATFGAVVGVLYAAAIL